MSLVLVLTMLVVAAPARGVPPHPDAAVGGELDAGLARVRARLASARHTERAAAHAALWALLNARRDASAESAQELANRRDELLALARRTEFAARYEEPTLERLFGGDTASWNPRSGALEIEYSRRSARDEAPQEGAAGGSEFHPFGFEERHGVLVSVIPFDGTCQLELRGRAPRTFVRDQPPTLWLLTDDDREFEMWFTWPSTHERSVGKWTQGKAQLWRRGQPTLLARDRTPGGKYDLVFDEPYVLKLRVTRTALIGSLNGFGMLKASKRRRGYGRLGFEHCPDVESVRLSGQLSRRALAAVRRQHWEAALARHLEQPSAPETALLPAWLADEAS